ncbi:MAG: hypothetical protein GY852_05325 [bacterium]|nr:hypothetical protein [bacterium]
MVELKILSPEKLKRKARAKVKEFQAAKRTKEAREKLEKAKTVREAEKAKKTEKERINLRFLGAAEDGDADAVRELLRECGAEVNTCDPKDGAPALVKAASMGKALIVGILLDAHAKIDAWDNFGWTALMKAAFAGNASIVKLLLERGANTEQANMNSDTALEMAKIRGHAEIVTMIKEHRKKGGVA